jgi:3'(2'), 5'-bisphosphate nucleotidase
MLAHDLLIEQLTEHRPDDIVLSEEGRDDPVRLDAPRTWIVDPLDGTQDYPYRDSIEWAVHVALVEGGVATAGAVACPAMGRLFGTDVRALPVEVKRPQPIVITGRSNTYHGSRVAQALGGRLATCGSAGIKAALVIDGQADVYVHSSGLYEWDACAPAAVAEAAGFVVRSLEGEPLVFNKRRPTVDGLVISRPEFADAVFETLA